MGGARGGRRADVRGTGRAVRCGGRGTWSHGHMGGHMVTWGSHGGHMGGHMDMGGHMGGPMGGPPSSRTSSRHGRGARYRRTS
eukprot:5042139-Prymnesium_polylepis.1